MPRYLFWQREKVYNALIVKYGEIGIKGKNRYIFENKLIKNIKNMLKPLVYSMYTKNTEEFTLNLVITIMKK